MSFKRFTDSKAACAWAVLAFCAQPVLAQISTPTESTVGETDARVLQVVTVTAQRRSQDLSDVGAAITAIGADTLGDLSVSDPGDLVKLVPGFHATQSYNSNPVYTLRGVGFETPNVDATTPVGLYLDEASVPYPYMSTGLLFDLERVEVLKGPQGTLYGQNVTGGLINFVSAKPTSSFEAGSVIELGNYSTSNFSGFISGPIVDGINGRLAVNSQNRNEGWQQSVTRNETLGEKHLNAIRGILEYDQGGAFTATLTGSYWKQTGDVVAPQTIRYLPGTAGNPLALASVIANPTSNSQADWASVSYQPQSDIGRTRPAPLTDSEFTSLSLNARYDISDNLTVASLSTYQFLDHRDGSDLAGLQINANFQDITGEIKSFSQELRLLGSTDRFDWSVGAYYADDDSNARQVGYNDDGNTIRTLRTLSAAMVQNRYTLAEISNSFGNYENKSESQKNTSSIFANVDYEINDQFSVSAGARYTEDKADNTACTYDYQGNNVPVINLFYQIRYGQVYNLQPGQCYTLAAGTTNFVDGPVKSSLKQDNFTYRGVLNYEPNPDTLLYASVSRGFKAGSFPLIAASSAIQFEPVDQEELNAYEAGAKLTLFNGTTQLNTSAFYYDYKDKQTLGRVRDVIFGTLSRIQNIPKSNMYGLEAELSWQITPELSLQAGGIYLQTEVEEYEGFTRFSVPADFEGQPFPYTPEYQGNVQLSYERPVTSELTGRALVSVSYQGETNSSFEQDAIFAVDAYTLVDGVIGVAGADDRWGLELYGNNLFDEYYWTGVANATDAVFRYAGMPREFGLRLKLKY